ncbi:hypothetical protein OD917_05560 [Flavobacterium sp. SH_e]|uniref:hypothetical protein n=1 Tax=Flavobacterium TaxID=237 RepID=UPI0021E4FC16|nr:hypothetical protein [Flavobacterium sp. SH_e]MCV2484379.1 hypothetical protein [Flavobacterium sp. SH_e]
MIELQTAVFFTHSDIDSERQRVQHFQGFRKSAVLSEFLRFIVNETMLERAGCIKEYAIAVNALKCPASFNGSNAIVRTHAVRLRKLLGLYYQAEGKYNDLRIEVPLGGYIPVFKAREAAICNAISDTDGGLTPAVFPLKALCADSHASIQASFLMQELSAQLSVYSGTAVLGCHLAEILRIYEKNASKAASAADLCISSSFAASESQLVQSVYTSLIKYGYISSIRSRLLS